MLLLLQLVLVLVLVEERGGVWRDERKTQRVVAVVISFLIRDVGGVKDATRDGAFVAANH